MLEIGWLIKKAAYSCNRLDILAATQGCKRSPARPTQQPILLQRSEQLWNLLLCLLDVSLGCLVKVRYACCQSHHEWILNVSFVPLW